MKRFSVTGMSCAACQTRIEKEVSKVRGVESVSVSLLTNSMQIEGNAGENDIIEAVEKAGYAAETQNKSNINFKDNDNALKDTETPKLRRRLITSIILLIPLMYISMGHTMWGWPLPDILNKNHIAMGLIQMLFTIMILIINQKFFISGIKALYNKSPNMDTLVALGAGASFIYSTYVLFAMTNAQIAGNNKAVMGYMHDFYFESAAMIVTLITVGKMLESHSKGKTTDALKGLMGLAPKTAIIIKTDENGIEIEIEVPIEQLNIGDLFIVKPGESIPVDGIVIDGMSAVDESALTGESIPIDKTEGANVSSASINKSGFLKCRATRVGEDTTLSQIIQMVSDASATKAPIAKIADKVSGIFVPVVIGVAIVTIVVWIIAGQEVGFALARGIAVLVISCPCALGLATPVAIMVGNGVGAKNGILFKNASAIENTGKTTVAALDKTGTITVGKPEVTDIIVSDNVSKEELLCNAYSIELKSEHPLARAVVKYCTDNSVEKKEATEFSAEIGNGLTGIVDGSKISGGNLNFIGFKAQVFKSVEQKVYILASQGKTPLFFAKDNKLMGIIAVSDVTKEESREAVNTLKNMGIRVIMLTGDNENTAKAIGVQAGVDEVVAGVLPQEKEKVVQELAEDEKTVMVGDGINDAPALTRADIGMAIGAGTDIAIDAADVVLMKSSLLDVPASIRLSRVVLKNIHENLFWAFIYNIIGIPLAAGLWYPAFGLKLNPMFGAAAMSLSSFCVVVNALRLNFVNIYSNKSDKKSTVKSVKKYKEKYKMEKVITIKGMMCTHCEATVKKALESLPQVNEAFVSHDKNQAIVKLNSEVSDDLLRKIIEEKEYVVEEIN